jgi:hypothetical protein
MKLSPLPDSFIVRNSLFDIRYSLFCMHGLNPLQIVAKQLLYF